MRLRERVFIVTVIFYSFVTVIFGVQIYGQTVLGQVTRGQTVQTRNPVPFPPHKSHFEEHAFAQDSLGYMWIATLGGLNQYNGYEYRHFSHIPTDSTSLGHDFVFSLLIDSSHTFWVGTANGVSIFDFEKSRFVHYSSVMTPVYSFLKITTVEFGWRRR